ncbi:hypothetical protein [Corynebacterium epidermidicanis]|uniref:Uncharacterized protein n=1 Tax=Corynebacterium epidermidicanis TaxID=1050174 RepID=A0A0G3GW88_9CORY|nr:hypothetical protein [Corynebacterium epidermidicanis]AKK03783.1 hypothetical protein CEPID_09690 [Corynebacterium epidermidicanis]
MKLTTSFGSVLAAGALILGLAVPAQAATTVDTYPETPKLNPQLPLVHTLHGSDSIKANIHNPYPVCNAWEDYRTVAYKVTDSFTPAGTVSTTNYTKDDINLEQSLSKTQAIKLNVQGDQTSTVSANAGYSEKGASFGIAASFAQKIGLSASYELSWQVGQKIGPYKVPAGHTGEASYGFRAVTFSGTQQYCKLDGTWSNPTPWVALVPVKNEVQVRTYDTLTGAHPGINPAELTDEHETAPVDPETHETVDAADPTPEEVQDLTGVTPEAPVELNTTHDIAPHFTVSSAKAAGYAGVVAVKLRNEGSKRYFNENGVTTFRVDIKTADGPQEVDRPISGYGKNGAHIRDLGYDRAKSTRTFEITLSNPVEVGDDQTVATLHFGDGNTKLGRLKNNIVITQTTRLADDNSTNNDQNVDSRSATQDDFGNDIEGLF